MPFYREEQIVNKVYDATNTALKVETVGGSGSASASSTTPTLTNVSSVATNAVILAANANRKQAMIFNDSSAVLYLKFGTTASATSYTAQIAAGGFFELPTPVYNGELDGIWASANGAARVTELT